MCKQSNRRKAIDSQKPDENDYKASNVTSCLYLQKGSLEYLVITGEFGRKRVHGRLTLVIICGKRTQLRKTQNIEKSWVSLS